MDTVQTKKRWFYPVALFIVILILGAIFGAKGYINGMISKAIASRPANYQTISSAKAKKYSWLPTYTSVGNLIAMNGVNITSQVPGKVEKIFFRSGHQAKKGDLLVSLADFTEVQQLNFYLAQLRINKLTLKRKKASFEVGGVSEQEYDLAKATYDEALVDVKKEQAEIDYKHIRAPFAGRVGIRQVNVGQYLKPGDTIANLQSLSPIYTDFELPQQYYSQIKIGAQAFVSVDTYPGKSFYGKVLALSSAVSGGTRGFTLRASFPNASKLLVPGSFVHVTVSGGKSHSVLVIPQTSVVYSLSGNHVYVLTKEKSDKHGALYRVKSVAVKLGDHVDNNTIVLSGLSLGDEVITVGQLKVRPDSLVRVNNKIPIPAMTPKQLRAS